jgi:virginiamycin B lyase
MGGWTQAKSGEQVALTQQRSERMRPLPTAAAVLALLAGLLVLLLALAPRAEAFVYWANFSSDAIGRADLDGTGVDEDFINGTRLPGAVAVDSRYIYWGGFGRETGQNFEPEAAIGRARLDGTKVDWRFIPVPAGVYGAIGQIAVDDDHIYWTEVVAHAGFDPTGSIGRANLDGTGVERQFITGFTEGAVPTGLAVDANHVYWSQNGGIRPNSTQIPAIGRANLDGTGVNRAFIPFSGGSAPEAVEVGAAHVYWINSRPEAFSPETIGRANLDGTGVEQSFIDGFTAHTNRPVDLAVDAGYIYWADQGVQEFTGTIGRADLDGVSADLGFVTPGRRASPEGVAVNFSPGKLNRNKKKGTALMTVEVPASGGVALAQTKQLKGAEVRAEAVGEVQLPIKPRGRAKEKLAEKGKVKVKAEVTYTPDGGEPEAQIATLRLIKRG